MHMNFRETLLIRLNLILTLPCAAGLILSSSRATSAAQAIG